MGRRPKYDIPDGGSQFTPESFGEVIARAKEAPRRAGIGSKSKFEQFVVAAWKLEPGQSISVGDDTSLVAGSGYVARILAIVGRRSYSRRSVDGVVHLVRNA